MPNIPNKIEDAHTPTVSFIITALGYVCAGLSMVFERAGLHIRLLAWPQYFVLANLASVLAFYKLVRGERYARWEPIRE